MNINEAARVVLRPQEAFVSWSNSQRYITATQCLVNAMLAELDQTPIDADWLRDHPWVNHPLLRVHVEGEVTEYYIKDWLIRTRGEFHTVIRLVSSQSEREKTHA